jgi:hypothetical protein
MRIIVSVVIVMIIFSLYVIGIEGIKCGVYTKWCNYEKAPHSPMLQIMEVSPVLGALLFMVILIIPLGVTGGVNASSDDEKPSDKKEVLK